MKIKYSFAKYVAQNILGMIGLSLYVIADAFFISKAEGYKGLAALNIALPIYNIIFAIGSMIGVGSAIKFCIAKASNNENKNKYFFNAISFCVIIGIIISVLGFVFTDKILIAFGANNSILKIGESYTKIFMSFAPIFMCNYVVNAFVRNDSAPTIAMLATLSSSIFNILFDYILMFPLNMGMNGAALATALSPVVGILICLIHLLSKKCNVRFIFSIPSLKLLFNSCKVGVSAFVGEISMGVITFTFNILILNLTGNIGVAAFGVVANISIVATSVFNGIALGSQPLISNSYGNHNITEIKTLKRLAIITSLISALILYLVLFLFTDNVVQIFNGENNTQLAQYAHTGVRLYFLAIFFAGINIVGSSYFSATENSKAGFVISILRGFVLIVSFAIILSMLFGITGVWLAYLASEFVTALITGLFVLKENKRLLQYKL